MFTISAPTKSFTHSDGNRAEKFVLGVEGRIDLPANGKIIGIAFPRNSLTGAKISSVYFHASDQPVAIVDSEVILREGKIGPDVGGSGPIVTYYLPFLEKWDPYSPFQAEVSLHEATDVYVIYET